MGKKKQKKQPPKVKVKTSKAHRRKGHHRKGTDVKTSKPLRIKAYTRAPPS